MLHKLKSNHIKCVRVFVCVRRLPIIISRSRFDSTLDHYQKYIYFVRLLCYAQLTLNMHTHIHTKCSNSENISLNGIHITSSCHCVFFFFFVALIRIENVFVLHRKRKKTNNNNNVSIARYSFNILLSYTSVCGIYCGIHKRCEEHIKKTKHIYSIAQFGNENVTINAYNHKILYAHWRKTKKHRMREEEEDEEEGKRTHWVPSSQYIIHIMTVSFIISCAFNFESISTQKCTRPERKGIESMDSVEI